MNTKPNGKLASIGFTFGWPLASRYGGMNEAFLDFFKENGVTKDFPARTAVQVGPLFYHEWKIEIEAVAIIQN